MKKQRIISRPTFSDRFRTPQTMPIASDKQKVRLHMLAENTLNIEKVCDFSMFEKSVQVLSDKVKQLIQLKARHSI